ncbi:hypothetical protein OIU74_011262 [Salix koriyanagi]|uniref:Uncharacterized protein n=1 Tax=Salix koriyanagi TaxID=2511006 RepID=A0A9Q0TEU3_9ROSI|nr:hypothetical protein OIU74_011262 [Salix koriyanagi]
MMLHETRLVKRHNSSLSSYFIWISKTLLLRELIDGFNQVLHSHPLRDICQRFEIAPYQGLDKVACLILGVPVRHIYNK